MCLVWSNSVCHPVVKISSRWHEFWIDEIIMFFTKLIELYCITWWTRTWPELNPIASADQDFLQWSSATFTPNFIVIGPAQCSWRGNYHNIPIIVHRWCVFRNWRIQFFGIFLDFYSGFHLYAQMNQIRMFYEDLFSAYCILSDIAFWVGIVAYSAFRRAFQSTNWSIYYVSAPFQRLRNLIYACLPLVDWGKYCTALWFS